MWGVVIGVLATVLQRVLSYFGAEQTLARVRLDQASDSARQSVEAERLKSTFERIEREPAHDDVAARLNSKFGGPK